MDLFNFIGRFFLSFFPIFLSVCNEAKIESKYCLFEENLLLKLAN